jgi:hypothetical protein
MGGGGRRLGRRWRQGLPEGRTAAAGEEEERRQVRRKNGGR